jgi:F-type H+-transporting ATP synthase subunit e
LQVLRYSALIFGVFYGFYHQSSLSAQAKIHKIDKDYAHKESLITKAKAAWLKKNLPADQKTAGGDSE